MQMQTTSDGKIKKNLMDALNKLMQVNQWSQEKAAAELGMTQPRISAIKNYKYEQLSVSRLLEALEKIGYQLDFQYNNNRLSSHFNQIKHQKIYSPVLLVRDPTINLRESPMTIMCYELPKNQEEFLINTSEGFNIYHHYKCLFVKKGIEHNIDGHIACIRAEYLGRTDKIQGIKTIGYPF